MSHRVSDLSGRHVQPAPLDRESSLIKFPSDWRKYAALTEIADAIIDEPEGLFAGSFTVLARASVAETCTFTP